MSLRLTHLTHPLIKVLLLGACLMVPATALAISSPTYTIPEYSLGQLTGQVSSQNYQLNAQVAPLSGTSTSATYGIDAGFPAETGGSITLALDQTSLSFGSLVPNTPSTTTVTATVTTSAPGGYSLALDSGSGLVRSGGAEVIDPIAASIASPASWSGSGFGFTVSSATNLEAKWSSGAAYAALPSQLTTIHQVTQVLNAPDATQVQFKASVSSVQKPGSYGATVGLLATALP